MAYNLNEIYNFMVFIVRKERGVFVTIPEFESTLDNAQIEAVSDWFELYGTTQKIHDAVRSHITFICLSLTNYDTRYKRQHLKKKHAHNRSGGEGDSAAKICLI